MTSRGIRNNNPGNIRHRDKWQGLAADQTDPDFCTFADPVWGIRAICRIILNYQKDGVHTVAAAVSRWAPPGETQGKGNDTAAYIRAVASAMGVDAGAVVDFDQTSIMFPMVKAIIAHENGSNPYPDSMIRDALRRAGIADVPPSSVIKKVSGPVLAGTSLTLGVVSQLAEPAKQAADVLSPFTASPWIGKAVTVIMTIAGIAAFSFAAKGWIDHRRGL